MRQPPTRSERKAPIAVEPASEGKKVIRDFDVAPPVPADKAEPSAILRACRQLAERLFDHLHGARR